jgi:hypothetical protein
MGGPVYLGRLKLETALAKLQVVPTYPAKLPDKLGPGATVKPTQRIDVEVDF